jgi:D-serine deaminase-like pyridoxal phosphate-dependent protein
MSSVRAQTIKAFNEQVQILRQSPENVQAQISLFTFNTQTKTVLLDKDVDFCQELTEKDYVPDGGTAMLDSVGYAIEQLSNLDCAHEKNTAFLLIVISDGEENSSAIYDYEDISNLITDRQNQGNWSVVYLGANQNLAEISKNLNIAHGNIQVFTASKEGMEVASGQTIAATSAYTKSLSGGKLKSQCFYSSIKDEKDK